MHLLYEVILAHYLYIDRDLMRLQRRETLWLAVLTCGEPASAEGSTNARDVRNDVDDRWAELWLSRPID